jgi:hypothetical protein
MAVAYFWLSLFLGRVCMSKFLLCYLVGGLVAISWAALPAHGPWDQWDLAIFHTVNGWLGQSALWADLVAITNNRLFDLAVLACMGLILARCFLPGTWRGVASWWRWA